MRVEPGSSSLWKLGWGLPVRTGGLRGRAQRVWTELLSLLNPSAVLCACHTLPKSSFIRASRETQRGISSFTHLSWSTSSCRRCAGRMASYHDALHTGNQRSPVRLSHGPEPPIPAAPADVDAAAEGDPEHGLAWTSLPLGGELWG